MVGRRQAVRHRILIPASAGSNPAGPVFRRRISEEYFFYMVGMAQLASAPDCGSGGRGFESHYPPSFSLFRQVSVAQLDRATAF